MTLVFADRMTPQNALACFRAQITPGSTQVVGKKKFVRAMEAMGHHYKIFQKSLLEMNFILEQSKLSSACTGLLKEAIENFLTNYNDGAFSQDEKDWIKIQMPDTNLKKSSTFKI